MTNVMVKRTPRELGTRDRMVAGAADLVRMHGVHATGIRQVVAHADAPRGSVQHHFPGGKDQLIVDAVAWAGRHTEAVLHEADAAELIPKVCRYWRKSLQDSDFLGGCTVFAAAVDGSDPVRDAIVTAVASWRDVLVDKLGGVAKPSRLATLILTAVEGAILLARAERSVQPLDDVEAELSLVLETRLTTQHDGICQGE